jgi:hypothetical protein
VPKVWFAALLEPLTILAFAGLLSPLWMPGPAGSLLLVLAGAVAGLGGAYAGARAGLDAALCRRLEAMAQGPSIQRVAGARHLLRIQALLLAVQAGALAMAGI